MTTKKTLTYASFQERLAALCIDSLILGTLFMPVQFAFMQLAFSQENIDKFRRQLGGLMGLADTGGLEMLSIHINIIGTRIIAVYILMIFVFLLYFPIFHSSSWKATPGKKLLKIEVTDLHGNRISFCRGVGRILGRQLSQLCPIGYIIQPITKRRQALHDILAGTLVINSR